ncbi:hypothetical protein D3C81_1850410 [compost metagenome]
MCRAYEVDGFPAIGQLVGHDFRDRQFAQRFFQCFLQTIAQHDAGDDTVEVEHFGFAVGFAFEAGDGGFIRAQGRQFFQQCRCGFAIGADADRSRHQFLHDGFVVGLFQHIGEMYPEATR